jgi:hypothetical protein
MVDFGEPTTPNPNSNNTSAERMKVKQDTLIKAMAEKDLTMDHEERTQRE